MISTRNLINRRLSINHNRTASTRYAAINKIVQESLNMMKYVLAKAQIAHILLDSLQQL